jgi:hypothetical protein
MGKLSDALCFSVRLGRCYERFYEEWDEGVLI